MEIDYFSVCGQDDLTPFNNTFGKCLYATWPLKVFGTFEGLAPLILGNVVLRKDLMWMFVKAFMVFWANVNAQFNQGIQMSSLYKSMLHYAFIDLDYFLINYKTG